LNFCQIKRFPHIDYSIDVSLDSLQETIDRYFERNLNMDPDFQRGHVWTKKQQIAFMEYLFKNPTSGKEIYFNHPNWMGSYKGEFVLVDGKQRLNAAFEFLNGNIPIFGCKLKDWSGAIPSDIGFHFNIARLSMRKEVLHWYLDFNAGGTPHSKKEIQLVRNLLEEENSNVSNS